MMSGSPGVCLDPCGDGRRAGATSLVPSPFGTNDGLGDCESIRKRGGTNG